MTDPASNNPDTFLTQINTAMEDVSDAIGQYLEDMGTAIIEHAEEGGTILGAAGGFLVGGPIGGLIGGFLGNRGGNELEEAFEDACNQINEKWDEVSGQIRTSIGSILGDPLMMSQIASDYRDAVRELGTVSNNIAEQSNILRQAWSGLGFGAYIAVATSQDKALAGMSEMFTNAADLMDDNSLKLVLHWSNQLNNLSKLALTFVEKSGDLGDAGNWFSLGAGVAVEVIGAAGKAAADIVTEQVNYMAELAIGSAGDWDGLDAQFGSKGMEGDQWPRMSPSVENTINTGPWTASA
jgi:uncharacterized protein YukE